MSEKVVAIHKWFVPHVMGVVRSCTGLTGYYQAMVKDTTLMSRLHALTNKDSEFGWTVQCHGTFDAVRLARTKATR